MFYDIINFFSQIDWSKINWNVLWNVLSLFLGAGITYFLTVKRENDKLRKDLQIKAADEVLSAATKVREDADAVINNNLSTIRLFKIFYDANIPDNSDLFDNNSFEIIHTEFTRLQNILNNSIRGFIRKVEARRIVLEELWEDIDFLYESIEKITNMQAEIYLVFFQCSKTKDITTDQLLELMIALEEMNKVVIHVFNKTLRFNTKLQNTYFSHLFKRTIPQFSDQQAMDSLVEGFMKDNQDKMYSKLGE